MIFRCQLKKKNDNTHMESNKGTHTKKHNEEYIQATHKKRNVFIFGYYYCSNGRGVREQEINNLHDDKEKKIKRQKKKNNFVRSFVLTGLRHK